MPSRKVTRVARAAKAALPSIPRGLIDQLVTGPVSPQAVQAVSVAFKTTLIERALWAELSHHLGYASGSAKPGDTTNHRDRVSAKAVPTEDGPAPIDVPNHQDGSFEPLLIPKRQRRLTEFDHKIVAMYARGMTVREIQRRLTEQYATQVSAEFISSVTQAVVAEVRDWQSRSLEPLYTVVFFDALRVKSRDEVVVRKMAVYLALGVLPDGTHDSLGLWIESTEGAKFWLKVLNNLNTRACQGILIAVTDGLKSVGEALGAVLSAATLQTCIVRLIRTITADWGRAAKEWRAAMNQYAIACGERFTQAVH